MSVARRALVIGGSMSGLLAGIALMRRGWDVAVYERVAEPLAGRGAGIVAQPELKAALRALGLDADRDLGVEVPTRVMYARDGGVTHRIDWSQTMTSWDRVFHLLKAALPEALYHRGKELRQIAQSAQGVTAHFADGSVAEGDLLVGADGIRSTVRQQYLPALGPLYAGYTAWRGLVAEVGISAARCTAQLFEDFAFCLPDNEQMLGYPVAGPDNDLRPGHRRYNFVWYRPASEERELPRLLTDESGRTHALSIPPPLIARDVVARDARSRKAGACAAVQRNAFALRAAVPAADLRPGSAAHGVRPGRDFGRCRIRGAPACRRRRRQGGR